MSIPACQDACANTGEDQRPTIEYSSMRELLLPFYLPTILLHMAKSLVLVVLPLEVLALGYSYHDVGTLSAIMGLGTVFGNVVAGKLVAAKGPKCGMLTSAFGHILASVATILATCLPQGALPIVFLGIASLLLGLSETTAVVSRVTILGAAVPTHLRGRVGSALGGTLRLGWCFGPLLAGITAHLAESRAVFALMGILALVSVVVILRFVPYISSTQQGTPEKGTEKAASGDCQASAMVQKPKVTMLGVVRKHWRVLFAVAFFSCCLCFVRKARELFFVLEGDNLGLSQVDIGNIVALSFILDFALFPVAGKMLDGIGRKPTGAISSVGLGCAMLTLVVGSSVGKSVSLAAYVGFAVLGGISNGLSAGLVQVMCADLAPPGARSEFIGVFRTLTRTADISAPAIIGFTAHFFTLQSSASIAACVGFVGALWVTLCVDETMKKTSGTIDSASMLPHKIGKDVDLEGDCPVTESRTSEHTNDYLPSSSVLETAAPASCSPSVCAV